MKKLSYQVYDNLDENFEILTQNSKDKNLFISGATKPRKETREKKIDFENIDHSNALFDQIKYYPYFKMTEKDCHDLYSDGWVNLPHSDLVSLSHNELMLKLVDIDYVKLSGDLEGFEVFHG